MSEEKQDPQIISPKVHHKKRFHDEESHEMHDENEPWIVSYSDMMTLLFCFFVIMTSFAVFDPIVTAKKSEEIADYMTGGEITAANEKLKKLSDEIAKNPDLKKITKAEVKDGNINTIFSTTVLYPLGETKVQDNFIKNIDIIITLIKNRDPDYRIIIEGHTDPHDANTIINDQPRSAWWLSSVRAALVAERFLLKGFTPNQIAAVGYGDSRPVSQSDDKAGKPIEENQALNRRVVIKVIKPPRGSIVSNTEFEDQLDNTKQ